MSNTAKTIPLSRLRLSPLNMRKTHTRADIARLAADIAAKGLLENLVVNKADGDMYEVVAGGRRLAALQRLADRKKIPKDHPVRCLVVAGHENGALLTEISLSENFQRLDAHPADQFEAFAALKAAGLSPAGIASRFGIAKAFVEQRLKLAAVSPRLLAEYRRGTMTLEQLMAFTVCDDRTLQESVWFEEPYSELDPSVVRRRLTRAQVEASDRRVRFVGIKAYEAAGGGVVRDLFDLEHEGYLTDSQLLDRIVASKLEAIAAPFRSDGWAFVEVHHETDYAYLSSFGRAAAVDGRLAKKDERRLQKLGARHDALVEQAELEESVSLAEKLNAIEAEIEAFKAKKQVWSAEDKARSGVVISVDDDGAVNIARGLIRTADGPAKGGLEADPGEKPRDGYPDSVLVELSAHRTAALRALLANTPAVAHLALLQAMVSASFHGCLSGSVVIRPQEADPERRSDSVGESAAAKSFFERHRKWASRVPEPENLWSWLRNLKRDERDELLALCVAATVDAFHGSERADAANDLAAMLNLDMRAWWKPSEAFLMRLSKADILAAVKEACSADVARRLSDRKKPVMAKEAAQLLAENAWLPPSLKTEQKAALAAE